tara:strand:- start:224 stop:814 length:591 start_codon:yes stop_codon:yes gene_type:complete
MAAKREITRDDIMAFEDYEKVRTERRRQITELKKNRRVPVGPDATFYFESYDTMWHQVHEMLYIEKGGEDQVPDELSAYNPLIPNGRELVATLMFEIDDAERRAAFLAGLGGVEETVTLGFSGETVRAEPEQDVDRTTADGKASSIQFLHFPFTAQQVEKFRAPNAEVTLGIGHDKYGHMAVLSEDVRAALAGDFD